MGEGRFDPHPPKLLNFLLKYPAKNIYVGLIYFNEVKNSIWTLKPNINV